MNNIMQSAMAKVNAQIGESQLDKIKQHIASLSTSTIQYIKTNEFNLLLDTLEKYCMSSMFSYLEKTIEDVNFDDEKTLKMYRDAKISKAGAKTVFELLNHLHHAVKDLEVDTLKESNHN